MERRVRVRFAPSPTGPLHIGGVRTALYNYLFAKKHGGDFILRIEDTDRTRFVEGAEEYIIESFKWLGIKFDEGVGIGGQYEPYRQSERTMYKSFAQQLINKDWAYYAFDTPEELDTLRKEYERDKKNFQYDCNTREKLRNSLTMTAEEVTKRIELNEHYVIRFKFPKNEDIHLTDLIRGEVNMNSSLLDDKVLFKSDGLPTYHLANVVDDYLMDISHVIRGEEWLPSCPLHVLLYRAFGWEDRIPQFAHLPLLLKPEGNGKLSKRDGDRLGFPVFPLMWRDKKTGEISSGYRESGYLPQAVVNMLALLGWNSGTEQELFTMKELIDTFSLERISKHGAKFDIIKAKWFNHQYFQKLANEDIAAQYLKTIAEKGITSTLKYTSEVVSLVKERCDFASNLWENSYYFYQSPQTYDEKIVAKRWKDNMNEVMSHILEGLRNMTNTDANNDMVFAYNAEGFLLNFINENQLNTGQVMNCVRLALVGESKGVNLTDIMRLIGRENTLARLEKAIHILTKS